MCLIESHKSGLCWHPVALCRRFAGGWCPDCVLSQKRGRRRGGAAGVVGWRCRLKRIILAFLAWTVQSGRKSHSPMAEWVAIPSEANFSGFFAWTVHPGQECHWLAEKGGL